MISAKQGKLDSAVSSFERALTFANLQEDKEAESAILTAIDDLKDRIAKGENGTGEWKEYQFEEMNIFTVINCKQ